MGHAMRTSEQQAAVDGLGRFLASRPELAGAQGMPADGGTVRALLGALEPFGLLAGAVPERAGGTGIDAVTHAMLFEELAAHSFDLSTIALINTFGAHLVHLLAEPALRDRYLDGIARGRLVCSLAFSEPDVGSDVGAIRTRARRVGDHYVIDGEKCWISNAGHSDVLVCAARTGDDPGAGLSYLLLDRREHPYEVRVIDKVAGPAQATGRIVLDAVRVPVSNRLGVEGAALRTTLATFERSRVFVAAQAVGVARRALDEAVRWAVSRRQHGRPIAGHQMVAAMLADMATDVDAARLLTLRAAARLDAGTPAAMEASMAKAFACEAAVRVTRASVQVHGAMGIAAESVVSRLAREALILPIPEGTTQIQQLIVARALTGIDAF